MAAELPLDKREDEPRRADFDLIRDLAALLDETGLSEIEIGDGPERIRVARTLTGTAAVPLRIYIQDRCQIPAKRSDGSRSSQ